MKMVSQTTAGQCTTIGSGVPGTFVQFGHWRSASGSAENDVVSRGRTAAALAVAVAVAAACVLGGAELAFRLQHASEPEGVTSTAAVGDGFAYFLGALAGALAGGLLATVAAVVVGATRGRAFGIAASAVAAIGLAVVLYARSRGGGYDWWPGLGELLGEVGWLLVVCLPTFLLGWLGAVIADD
jgi:hypothetical protein